MLQYYFPVQFTFTLRKLFFINKLGLTPIYFTFFRSTYYFQGESCKIFHSFGVEKSLESGKIIYGFTNVEILPHNFHTKIYGMHLLQTVHLSGSCSLADDADPYGQLADILNDYIGF